MQLQDALGQFQVQLSADGRSEHTRNQYQRHVAALIAWLKTVGRPTDIASITPNTVAEFFGSDAARLSARGGTKKATSANAQRTSLRCFFRWLHESGLVATNAARLLKRARCAPPPPKALHPDEQERLLAVVATAPGPAGERDRMLIQLLLGCGLRLGSALGLDVGDVDLVHNELQVRKAKGDRPCTVMTPNTISKRLRAFIGDRVDGPLFLANGHRVSTRHAQRRLAAWLKAAGVGGKSAHSLRHSYAMRIYDETQDLLVTQAALGHSSVTSTVCYAKVDRKRLRAVVGE
ncbi:MAG TPA: tyrosine-type recombinase/integrase [Planctomycetota bacterium]|nr:tyrosine-type recombinase/integrase [Planctomycetota bacterium]